MKHGHGTRGAALASNAARRVRDTAACASGRVMPHGFFLFFSRLAPMRLRLGLIRTESGQLRPYRLKPPIQAKIQKKKKRCKTHRLNLILNPTSAHFTQTHQTSALCLSLTPSLVSHSLCALCLCLCSL